MRERTSLDTGAVAPRSTVLGDDDGAETPSPPLMMPATRRVGSAGSGISSWGQGTSHSEGMSEWGDGTSDEDDGAGALRGRRTIGALTAAALDSWVGDVVARTRADRRSPSAERLAGPRARRRVGQQGRPRAHRRQCGGRRQRRRAAAVGAGGAAAGARVGGRAGATGRTCRSTARRRVEWLDGAADDIGAAFDRADVSFDRASGLQRAMKAEASGFISHGGRLLEQMGGFFDDVNDSLEEQAVGAATRLEYVLRENGETARELLHLPDAAAQRAAENLRAKYEAIKQDPHSDEHEEVEEGAVIIAMHTRRWLSGTYRRRRQLIVLQLSVAKAAGVENCRQLGLPDPYCRINLEGRYASLARETRVGWRKSEDKGEGEAKREYGKTLDPLWGEQFILMVQYEDELVLQLPLRDKESVLADTPMGHVHVPIRHEIARSSTSPPTTRCASAAPTSAASAAASAAAPAPPTAARSSRGR